MLAKRPGLESEDTVKATEEELEAICRLLQVNAIQASCLDLEGASIGSEETVMISEALLTNTTLTSLNLASE